MLGRKAMDINLPLGIATGGLDMNFSWLQPSSASAQFLESMTTVRIGEEKYHGHYSVPTTA
jgi:hypothetical protein